MQKQHAIALMITILTLSACSTVSQHPNIQTAANFIQKQEITTTQARPYANKKASQIALFKKEQSPHAAYRIIGTAKVAKHNLLGIERNKHAMETMMKSLAASIGGDGIININQNPHGIEGQVIEYQRILL